MKKTTKPTKPICKHCEKKEELEIELLDLRVKEALLAHISAHEIHKILDGRKITYIA